MADYRDLDDLLSELEAEGESTPKKAWSFSEIDALLGEEDVMDEIDKAAKEPDLEPDPEPLPEPEPEEVESDPEKAEIVPVQSKVAILRATDETHPDGPGKAYRYWDYAERMYILTTNFWVARQSSDLWDVLWVWYQNGAIHHVMTKKEMQRYLP